MNFPNREPVMCVIRMDDINFKCVSFHCLSRDNKRTYHAQCSHDQRNLWVVRKILFFFSSIEAYFYEQYNSVLKVEREPVANLTLKGEKLIEWLDQIWQLTLRNMMKFLPNQLAESYGYLFFEKTWENALEKSILFMIHHFLICICISITNSNLMFAFPIFNAIKNDVRISSPSATYFQYFNPVHLLL